MPEKDDLINLDTGMNTTRYILVGQVAWMVVFGAVLFSKLSGKKELPPTAPIQEPPAIVMPVPPTVPPMVPTAPPEKPKPTDPELVDVHVPIPKEMRVYNKSGSQCVWCTIEMLAKFNDIKGAKDLTLTYKHATGPREVARVLNGRGVKFKQTIRKDEDMLEEYVMRRKLGVGVGVNHGSHMILVCHFDRQAKIVKVIDNSDRSLRVQTWTLDQFRRKWSDWVLVILPDNEQATGTNLTPLTAHDDPEWQAWWNSKR